MPAPPLANNFDCGTDDVTITNGNSGGACGDAVTSTTIAADGTLTFQTEQAHSPANSMRITTVLSAATRIQWTGMGSITTEVFFRTYLYMPALPGSQFSWFSYRDNAAGRTIEYQMTSGGLIRVIDGAPAADIVALQGTVAVATGQWVRLEGRVLPSLTVGEADWFLYNTADSQTASETKAATGLTLGANISEARVGVVTTPAPTNFTGYWDDVKIATDGRIGPSVSLFIPRTLRY
jgi:hypothetical protein